jgi:FAD/FMN-containing dehydrogenase
MPVRTWLVHIWTSGIVSHTGFAGLTLGGGIGWLMRAYAASCDNLLGAQLVSADGDLLEISHDHELLWALRGAGANFGVVTRLDVRVHAVGPEVLAGVLLFPADRAETVLPAYRDIAAAAPRELTTIVNLRHAPALPSVPEALQGSPVVIVALCWCGPLDVGVRQADRLRALRPVLDTVAPRPYVEHQQLFNPAVPHGLQYHWRSEYVADLGDDVLRALLADAWAMSSKRSSTIVFQLGGALAEVNPDSAVFFGRSGFAVNINGVWAERSAPDDDTAWVRRVSAALRPHSTGVYVNFIGDDGPTRLAATYGTGYGRLADLKRRYDRDNVFRHNHNIPPGGRDPRCVATASTAPSPGQRSSSATAGPS